ncbi:hypothetical protein CHUAL_004544 [Chamberlinius hualienensis]
MMFCIDIPNINTIYKSVFVFLGDGKPSLKLKLKLGSHNVGEKNVALVQKEVGDDDNPLIEVVDDIPPVTITVPESEISDEDAWLEALESGKLDEYDELKRMKDPALMTARQRALLENKQSNRDPQLREYMMLPSGYKEKEMTEEMIQKREMRAKKRRQQAQEKREKAKIQTLDRLLKKQDPRPKGNKSKALKKSEVPRFMLVNKQNSVTISIPEGYEFPLSKTAPSISATVALARRCGVTGCKNLKKYSCSKTGVPLCSLECYRKNLKIHHI